MRKLLLAFAISLIAVMPLSARAQAPSQAQTAAAQEIDYVYPFFLAAGAVGSVIVLNLLTSGYVGALPISVGTAAVGSPVNLTETALSRVYAVTGIVVGGWLANWLYTGK